MPTTNKDTSHLFITRNYKQVELPLFERFYDPNSADGERTLHATCSLGSIPVTIYAVQYDGRYCDRQYSVWLDNSISNRKQAMTVAFPASRFVVDAVVDNSIGCVFAAEKHFKRVKEMVLFVAGDLSDKQFNDDDVMSNLVTGFARSMFLDLNLKFN